MESVKELAIQIFDIHNPTKCRCGGSHEICLSCSHCRAKEEDQIPSADIPINMYIDHTILKPDATRHQVKNLCREADSNEFKAVCVNPCNVFTAKHTLENSLLCSVIGFPLGTNITEVKVFETEKAIEQGADEIDMVINLGELKSKEYKFILQDIQAIADLCRKNKVLLKVIHENCLLNTTEKIICCLLSKKAGAHFVKTSTGFSSGGATVEDIKLMREVVGPKLGVKAAGGIRDRKTADAMIEAGANRIGASQSLFIVNGV